MQSSCNPELVSSLHFLKIVVDVKALRPPHVPKLWLAVSKGMLLVKYFCLTKPLFVPAKINGDHKAACKR